MRGLGIFQFFSFSFSRFVWFIIVLVTFFINFLFRNLSFAGSLKLSRCYFYMFFICIPHRNGRIFILLIFLIELNEVVLHCADELIACLHLKITLIVPFFVNYSHSQVTSLLHLFLIKITEILPKLLLNFSCELFYEYLPDRLQCINGESRTLGECEDLFWDIKAYEF